MCNNTNSPAATLIASLQAKGAKIILHDPYVREWDLGPHEIERDLVKAATNSDCLALVTKHSEYFDLDLDKIKSVMRTPIIIDGRNVFDQKTVEAKGFEYRCVGKFGIQRD